jgi:hypothetical protein
VSIDPMEHEPEVDTGPVELTALHYAVTLCLHDKITKGELMKLAKQMRDFLQPPPKYH